MLKRRPLRCSTAPHRIVSLPDISARRLGRLQVAALGGRRFSKFAPQAGKQVTGPRNWRNVKAALEKRFSLYGSSEIARLMQSFVSILIPCHNAEKWVAQAIESALAQTWPEKEVLVVDDGSTDRSLQVIRSFGDRIRWETGPNRGGNVARNRLLTLARGEWLQYLDAGDYLLPEKIERQMEFLGSKPKQDVVYGPMILEHWSRGESRRDIRPIPKPHDPWILLARCYFPQTGAPAPPGPARHHRLGANQLSLWRKPQRRHREAALRPLLHSLFFPAFGLEHDAQDHPRDALRQRKVGAAAASFTDTGATITGARQFHFAKRSWDPKRPRAVACFEKLKFFGRARCINQTRNPIHQLQVALGIDHYLGQRVAVLASKYTGGDLGTNGSRQFVVSVHVKTLNLTLGRYTMTLFARVNGETAHWIRRAGSFDVDAADDYGSGRLPAFREAVFLMDHRFEIRQHAALIRGQLL
jgi:glycosyltransferase involved in cell wall biosynthesis